MEYTHNKEIKKMKLVQDYLNNNPEGDILQNNRLKFGVNYPAILQSRLDKLPEKPPISKKSVTINPQFTTGKSLSNSKFSFKSTLIHKQPEIYDTAEQTTEIIDKTIKDTNKILTDLNAEILFVQEQPKNTVNNNRLHNLTNGFDMLIKYIR